MGFWLTANAIVMEPAPVREAICRDLIPLMAGKPPPKVLFLPLVGAGRPDA